MVIFIYMGTPWKNRKCFKKKNLKQSRSFSSKEKNQIHRIWLLSFWSSLWKKISGIKKAFASWNKKNLIKLIETRLVKNLQEVNKLREKYITDGYEGIIFRNKKGLYVSGKKSPYVFRSKDFRKGTFKIIGTLEGKENNKGPVIWKLQCLKIHY